MGKKVKNDVVFNVSPTPSASVILVLFHIGFIGIVIFHLFFCERDF